MNIESFDLNDEQDEKVYKLIKKCRKNFVFAALVLLGLELWVGQKAMLLAMMRCRFVMIVAGRGLGKSFIMAVYAILKAMLFPKERIGIVSYSFRQAKFVFAEISRRYAESPTLQNACLKPPTLGSDSCYLPFKNGSFIQALPLGDGEKIRGARFFTILLDEAVKIPFDIIELSILPMMNVNKNPMQEVAKLKRRQKAEARGEKFEEDMASGNQVIMATTAWFQVARLYDLFKEWTAFMEMGHPDYKVLSYTYMDAPEGYLDKDFIEMTRRTMSPVRFAMENLAYWPPDTDGFFPYGLFHGCRANFKIELQGTKGCKYVIGIDPARENDNFVIGVAQLGNPAHKLVYMEVVKATTNDKMDTNGYAILHRKVRQIYRAFNSNGAEVVRIGLDAGGGGYVIRDMLSEPFNWVDENGKAYVEPRILQIAGQNEQHDEVFRHQGGLQILDMCNWSSSWINETAWHLHGMLSKRHLLFPQPNRDGDEEKFQIKEDRNTRLTRMSTLVDVRDLFIEEIEEMIYECTNIVHKEHSVQKGLFHFTVAREGMKKDRWAALMLVSRMIYEVGRAGFVPNEIPQEGLVVGFVAGEETDQQRQQREMMNPQEAAFAAIGTDIDMSSSCFDPFDNIFVHEAAALKKEVS